jgi:hypothetical protein
MRPSFICFKNGPDLAARIKQFLEKVPVEFRDKVRTYGFRDNDLPPRIFCDPAFVHQFVHLPSHGLSGDPRCLANRERITWYQALLPVRIHCDGPLDILVFTGSRIELQYIVVRDLAEHNGQNEVPFELLVDHVEMPQSELPHDDGKLAVMPLVGLGIYEQAVRSSAFFVGAGSGSRGVGHRVITTTYA